MRTTSYKHLSQIDLGLRVSQPGALMRRAWQAYTGWIKRRATEQALASLSDQTLHDIGLHRSEISSISRDLIEDRRRRGW